MKLRPAHRFALAPAAGLLLLAGCSSGTTSTDATTTTTTVASGRGGSSTTAKPAGTTAPSGTTPSKTTGSGVTNGTTPASAELETVAEAPEDLAERPDDWGDQTVIAVPKEGQPVIAFTHLDVNKDGKPGDDEILLSSYQADDRSWTEPKSVLKGNFEATSEAPALAMAADPSTGAIAIATLNRDEKTESGNAKGIKVSWSTDGGKTFASKAYGGDDSASAPAIAVRDGKVAVTYSSSDGVHVLTGTSTGGKAPTTLDSKPAPGIGADEPSGLPSSVTIDDKGRALVAYHLDPNEGYNRAFVVWAVGSDAPIELFDSAGRQNDGAHTGIASRDGAVVAGSTLVAEGATDDRVARVSVSTDGGATWSAPAGVLGDNATSPRSMALGAFDGEGALFAYSPNSGSDGQACTTPKVAVSRDDKTWIPCVSPTGNPPLSSNVYPGVATEGDTAWIVFTNHGEQGSPNAVLVWQTTKDTLTRG